MCRMVGLIASGTREEAELPAFWHLVSAQHSLRTQATAGRVPEGEPPGHTDSWGIGWFDAAGQVSLMRQTGWVEDSPSFIFAAETATRRTTLSGPAQVLIGHLRKASVGAVTSDNAHPMRADYRGAKSDPDDGYQTLLVAHNGTLHPPLR